jgi:energy-coupling factor transporter ATP-binding protein EcfA2
MKLISFQVREYKSTRDSNSIEVGDVTCLVGKNESGKTSLLQALYKLNPIIPEHSKYDVVDEYPRADVEDYRQAIEAKQRTPATVIEATFALDDAEVDAIEKEYGKGVVPDKELTVSKKYDNGLVIGLSVNEKIAGTALLARAGMESDLKSGKWSTFKELATAWDALATQKAQAFAEANAKLATITDADEKKAAETAARQLEETNHSKQGRTALAEIVKRNLSLHIWETLLKPKLPKFLYFDEYYQMEGHVNIEALQQRQGNPATLLPSDHPMLGLIELARLKLSELTNPARTEELLSKLEGASNHLSKQVLKYWSQNKHLTVRFDVRPARPGDPPGMNSGTNLLGRVYDSVHLVSTPLGTRSKGFVWFFSFVAWFSQQQKRGEPLILLLDEPGLVLHGTAQGDLLRYIEEQLKPGHQVIYTTHSPFMVDATRFDRVRIVEDKSMDATELLPPEQAGTKVYTDVLEVTSGSLFPLQGALGYELSQTLFVGHNSLIVEGVSDLLYLQIVSAVLERKKRTALSGEWTITPVGGAEKVSTFVALLGAQKGLTVATLIDIQEKDRQQVENLYKRKLLQKQNVLTFAEFTGKKEADIEDMFEVDFYLDLVNGEYKKSLTKPLSEADLTAKEPRILVRLEKHLEQHPLQGEAFNHFRPARYFSEHMKTLEGKLSDATLDRFEKAFVALNGLIGK